MGGGVIRVLLKPEQVSKYDVVFAALPTGQIMKTAADILKSGTKIIDLGAEFSVNIVVEHFIWFSFLPERFARLRSATRRMVELTVRW